MTRSIFTPAVLRWSAALAAALSLSACAPLVLGTAVGGAFVATDRRTSGTQLEDQGIKIKAANRIREVLKDRGNVNVNAYNRRVLLTGEVPTEADRAAAAAAAGQTENVAGVVNELMVGFNSTLSSRSNDVLVGTKVRATLVDARDLMSNAFNVVVERGDVYLMGIVTEREANRAAELVSTISGVRRVVKVFEIISEDELARKLPRPVSPAASDSAQP
jgi:osmotically-inducible protein OsmY